MTESIDPEKFDETFLLIFKWMGNWVKTYQRVSRRFSLSPIDPLFSMWRWRKSSYESSTSMISSINLLWWSHQEKSSIYVLFEDIFRILQMIIQWNDKEIHYLRYRLGFFFRMFNFNYPIDSFDWHMKE